MILSMMLPSVYSQYSQAQQSEEDVDALNEKGREAYMNGEYDKAISFF